MSDNDRIILTQLLGERRKDEAPELSDDKYFEYFVNAEVMKDHDLDADEIQSGSVAGGNDGGIDGLYVLLNGALVGEDYETPRLSKGVRIELVFTQAKRTKGFEEDPLNRLQAAADDLLDLAKAPKSLRKVYNDDVIKAIERFRKVQKEMVSAFPEVRFAFSYATLGDEPHPKVERKTAQLEKTLKRHFPDSLFSFTFLGARDLLALARRQPRRAFDLRFIEQTISARGPLDYLCLVNLAEYKGFITDESGGLLVRLFDANVRDYQASAEVNRGLRDSLQKRQGEDFWWLNNGVTILASKATQSGKVLTVEDPQIVNGLQTSREIFDYFKVPHAERENRNVLVRVIIPEDEESRDRIIRATNSQTPIPPASLRATDPVHRNIEDHLRTKGLFYDRKKGQYRNQGRPLRSIISIPWLAQAVLSIALHRPNDARARPSSLLKDDEMYGRVFSSKHPLDLYLKAAQLMRRVETFLRGEDVDLTRTDQNNVRFYVAMLVAWRALAKKYPKIGDYAQLNVEAIGDKDLERGLRSVLRPYRALGSSDQVAKGTALASRVLGSARRAVK